jgi:hypothetical protein
MFHELQKLKSAFEPPLPQAKGFILRAMFCSPSLTYIQLDHASKVKPKCRKYKSIQIWSCLEVSVNKHTDISALAIKITL